ncbi:MAG: IS200/IS605 family transposase [Acidobacteriia bacterium]|nr:IS200/IS605 family transposase [Terriglobia bacterium]
MPHALVNNRVHVIFSTKGRQKLIPEDRRPRLWAFMGGIARKNGFTAVAVGGTDDHAHALLAIPATMPLAKAVQLIKGGSSKWCNENLPCRFAWQEGYAALSVSASHKDAVMRYIYNQKEHHAKRTFEEELLQLLKKSGLDFDPNDVFG